MITPNFFSLKVYFENTNKYYLFFDGLIKKSGRMQRDILAEVKIPTSSYRVSRNVETSRTDSHLVLLNYFNIKPLNSSKQTEYEYILAQLYAAIYYKNDVQIDFLYSKIVDFIKEDNFLKPIFVLFKILIKMNNIKNYSDFLKAIKEDLDYICFFPKEYFYEKLEVLYLLVLLFTNRDKKTLHSEIGYDKYPSLTWLYYHILGTFAYLNDNCSEAILFYKKAEDIYFQDCNINRYILMKNNIAAMYNRMGYENLALDTIQPVFSYITNINSFLPVKSYIIMHYFMALFMLKHYKEIIMNYELYLDNSNILPTTAIILMFCYKMSDYNNEKCLFLKDLDERTKLIYEFLFEKRILKSKEKELIETSNYLRQICQAMKI